MGCERQQQGKGEGGREGRESGNKTRHSISTFLGGSDAFLFRFDSINIYSDFLGGTSARIMKQRGMRSGFLT